jgi:DNA-directed RNA polymerase specialized sigma24 family protein
MTSKQASFWIRKFEPLIRSLHRKHGLALDMSIDDVRQEAWIAISRAAESVDSDRSITGLFSVAISHHVGKLSRAKRKRERAEHNLAERESVSPSSYSLDRLLALNHVIESELSDGESTLLGLLLGSESKGEIMRSMGKRSYYKARDGLREKVSEAVAA